MSRGARESWNGNGHRDHMQGQAPMMLMNLRCADDRKAKLFEVMGCVPKWVTQDRRNKLNQHNGDFERYSGDSQQSR